MSTDVAHIGPHTLYCGDALHILPTLPDASVNLICVDPPYFKIKMDYAGEKLTWDRQWPTRTAYLAWLRSLALEWKRVLRPNGSVYVFASPQMAAHVEVMLGEVFQVLNHIVWVKHDGSGAGTGGHSKVCKEDLMSYFPQTEHILFCEQYGFPYESIRQYLDREIAQSGWSIDRVRDALGFTGNMPFHWFARGLANGKKSEWQLPTQDHYEQMQKMTRAFARPYQDLRREYEDLRRPFSVSPSVPYTDVWASFPTVPAAIGKHPCEKPLSLYRHIVLASSRPGDVCLDTCAGSFAFLDAARRCGRIGIGIEQDRRWWQRGCQRLRQTDLFEGLSVPVKAPAPQQLTLA